jgi:hypothetical protein
MSSGYLNKKSWAVGRGSNLAKVQEAKKKEEERQKRLLESRRRLRDEKEFERLQNIGRASGTLRAAGVKEQLDFMYNVPREARQLQADESGGAAASLEPSNSREMGDPTAAGKSVDKDQQADEAVQTSRGDLVALDNTGQGIHAVLDGKSGELASKSNDGAQVEIEMTAAERWSREREDPMSQMIRIDVERQQRLLKSAVQEPQQVDAMRERLRQLREQREQLRRGSAARGGDGKREKKRGKKHKHRRHKRHRRRRSSSSDDGRHSKRQRSSKWSDAPVNVAHRGEGKHQRRAENERRQSPYGEQHHVEKRPYSEQERREKLAEMQRNAAAHDHMIRQQAAVSNGNSLASPPLEHTHAPQFELDVHKQVYQSIHRQRY